MIARIWHGYTSFNNAPVYEDLLRSQIFPSIEEKHVEGYRKITLLKRILEEEVEFITIMLFDDLASVKEFAGEDHERSYVPDTARAVLERFDDRAQHYEVLHEILY